MKTFQRPVLLGLVILAGSGLLFGGGNEKSQELPETIARLVRKAYPEAEILRVRHDDHDGEVEYDIKLKLKADGRAVDVEAWTDAGITRTEEQLRPDSIPSKVQKALRKAFPKARIRDGRQRSEIRTTYEIEILVDGKRREVTLSPRGKILEVD
ncbi:MAG TPA: hypothetical protein VEC99_03320 [Clostridia bacterium]|nr:hypothetical protein [Clostridia bacterium]